jgi:MBG domain
MRTKISVDAYQNNNFLFFIVIWHHFSSLIKKIFVFHGRIIAPIILGLFYISVCSMLKADTVAVVNLSNLDQLYDGRPKQATVTTAPAGLKVSVSYSESTNYPASESPVLRINAGSYIVRAKVIEPGFTGESIKSFTIRKNNQGSLNVTKTTAKKLGDEPFQISAAPASGLSLTRWESSDPSVATISSNGMVTMIGTGQTSLIAVQEGDTNYFAKREAVPLDVTLSGAAVPEIKRALVFSNGSHAVNKAALPSGQASFVSYRDKNRTEPQSSPQVIFQNGPDVLDLSYVSTGFHATSTWGLGKYLEFDGEARQLHSCDVTLVNWARYDNTSPEWLAANPHLFVPPTSGVSIPGDSGGYYHPITLSFYEYGLSGSTQSFRLLHSKTINAFIPWRPMRLADGSNYPFNGHAFRIPFEFSDGFILPEFLIIGVSFNTQNAGIKPIGVVGPYNFLNVPFIPDNYTPKIGTSLFDPYVFDFENWIWTGLASNQGPMLRVRATETTASLTPPVNAGTYEVKTFSSAFPELFNATSTWVIDKAPVQINLSDTRYFFDGLSKAVTISTIPAGIPTVTSYSGSTIAPKNVGRYDVVVEANHANYRGTTTEFMTINDTFRTWKDVAFADTGLTEREKADDADPDGDGLNNLMAYAANLKPTGGNGSSVAKMDQEDDTLTFTYRSNALAGDVVYAVEVSDDLGDPLSWKPVVPKEMSVVSDDGKTRVNEVKIDKPKDEKQLFMRLKVERAADSSSR